MRKRKVIVLATLALAAVVFLLLNTDEREPKYNGHSLSYWVNIFGDQWYNFLFASVDPRFAEATNAVSHIGTNALPYLLKWIRYEQPSWRSKLIRQVRQLPSSYLPKDKLSNFIEGNNNRKAYYAASSFRILGTNALPALPELTAMMRDTTSPNTALRAAFALSALGPSAFPILTNALADPKQPNRQTLVFAIYASMPKVVGTNACLPPLVAALTDSNPLVRDAATGALTHLAPEAITNSALPNVPDAAAITNAFSE
jgi:hypothetical protein